MDIIGRDTEITEFKEIVSKKQSSFIVVYGRRRIGKTYLIRNHFKTFDFYHTGVANIDNKQQLQLFHKSLINTSKNNSIKPPKNWFDAFENLQKTLEKSRKKKKIVFLDEAPWLHGSKSNFLSALEHFWNHWASAREDIILIVCGSATSWIVNKIFNNKGGLHNRVTNKIYLKPFTLKETEAFLIKRKIFWNKYQIVKAYMVFGGVPFYLENLKAGKSIDQNINELLFADKSLFQNEFNNLYHSLFKNPENYIQVIQVLASKNKGLTRNEIIKHIPLNTGGSLSTILQDLELSGFIRKYNAIGKKERDVLYQLVDAYSLFYYNFIHSKKTDSNFWLQNFDSAKIKAWSGYAFEMVCLLHAEQIKKGLGIEGVYTNIYAWQTHQAEKNAQIDLIFDRKDQIINVFEIKFSTEEYTITSKYMLELLNKIAVFKTETKTKKAVFLSLLSTYGLKNNENTGMIQNSLTLETLFY
ncbi:AAA family ATPase [Flavobacterium sp.]|uniref:AAA family ATPase n=1 Tax=Flavobacterium sp. TaxID=239 RepID=UPI003D1529F1